MLAILILSMSGLLSANAEMACNGSVLNCDQRYDELAYFTTHNSFNYQCKGDLKQTGPLHYLFPNQERPIEDQLEAGVRAFMIDLHQDRKDVIFCHGGKACGFLGKEPVLNTFQSIFRWMMLHPGEVVTLILESYITSTELRSLLVASHLNQIVHCQKPGHPWPTLREMRDSPVSDLDLGQPCTKTGRLVILNDRVESGDSDWNLDLFGRFAFETRYSFSKPSELDCALNRGVSTNPLFVFNHFTTWISGKKHDAKRINRHEAVMSRIRRCEAETGRKTNFITVDFYRTGSVKTVVDEINASRIDFQRRIELDLVKKTKVQINGVSKPANLF